jgi:sigma-E factor negative regulatory protein RseC
MKELIVKHPGVVRKVSGNVVEVYIIVTSGCASCEVKGSCSMSETKEKSIEVEVPNPDKFLPGQSVTVEMKQSQGTWAVMLGYFFPFIVLITSLFTFVLLDFEQGIAGLFSLGMVVIYFLALIFFKGYLRSKFTYRLS